MCVRKIAKNKSVSEREGVCVCMREKSVGE